MKPQKVTLPQLNRWCKEWQKRLRLQDWAIKIVLNEELDNLARLTEHPQHKCATLRIRPVFSAHEHGCLDFEVSLVHELLHLHCFGFDHEIVTGRSKKDATQADRDRYDAYERMVELTAQALVSAKRGKQVPPYTGVTTEF